MSSPIAISSKHTSSHEDMAYSSSSSSSMLYVPVHKRDTSPTRSESDQRFYSRDFLLSLQRSPLARLEPEKKEHLRSVFPEIAMNRKMRKSLEYHAAMHEKALKAQALGQVPTSPISETIHHHQEGAPHVHHRENSHSPQPHSPQHHVKESHHTHSPQHQHQPKHDSHPKESHPTQESSPTYNPFSPLAPHQRPQQQMPNLRRGRSGARAPERRRYAFGLKTRHGDLDSAVTWRGAGAGRIITAPSVVSV